LIKESYTEFAERGNAQSSPAKGYSWNSKQPLRNEASEEPLRSETEEPDESWRPHGASWRNQAITLTGLGPAPQGGGFEFSWASGPPIGMKARS
jgi:hypothetical protein